MNNIPTSEKNMNSIERWNALLTGRRPDRVPFMFQPLSFAAKIVGYNTSDVYSDPNKCFWAQMWTQEMFGHDGLTFFIPGAFGASEFGGEIKLPGGEFSQSPTVVRYPVESEADVWKLKIPDVENAGGIPLAFQFSKLQKEYGHPITCLCGSPLTRAGYLCGVEKMCRWMVKKPAVVHQLLRIVTDFLKQVVKYWVDFFGPELIIAWENAPTDSNQVISPKYFEEFSFPYLRELHEHILANGIKHIHVHICGEQNMNLPMWQKIPMGDIGIVSFGHEIDITTAVEYFGETCIIAGNVEPALIQSRGPQQVYKLSKECIEKGKYAPRGYALKPGCEVSHGVPPHNVYVMKKAVEDFGWY